MPFNGHRAVSKPDGSGQDAWFSYTCGNCGRLVSGALVAYIDAARGGHTKWLQCTACGLGSVINNDQLLPSVAFGPEVAGLPADVEQAYQEARNCMIVSSYTAAELLCRKILMHVAVDKGAKEGDGFAAYITFLTDKGYITPAMKGWVDLIQKHGNKATHKLAAPDQERAESTLMFTAELLRIIYEMEHVASKYVKP